MNNGTARTAVTLINNVQCTTVHLAHKTWIRGVATRDRGLHFQRIEGQKSTETGLGLRIKQGQEGGPTSLRCRSSSGLADDLEGFPLHLGEIFSATIFGSILVEPGDFHSIYASALDCTFRFHGYQAINPPHATVLE